MRRFKTPSTPLPNPNLVEISTATVIQAMRSVSDPAPLTLMIEGSYQLGIHDDFYARFLEKVIRTLERLRIPSPATAASVPDHICATN